MTPLETQMLTFIKTKMKYDTWVPVRTDEAYSTIISLIQQDLIPEIEFNNHETYIQKVDFELKNTGLSTDYSNLKPKLNTDNCTLQIDN